MKKLIWIHSIIREIEEVKELNLEYRSKFTYLNELEMKIETYCTDAAIGYYKALEDGFGYTIRIENANLKIIEHLTD